MLSFCYLVVTQGIVKSFMVPNLKAPIRAIMSDENGYYAETDRQTGKDPYKIKITKEQYEQMDFSGRVQTVFLIVYGLVFIVWRSKYDKRFPLSDSELK